MFKIGNLVVTTEEYGSKKLVLTKIDGEILTASTLNGSKNYSLRSSQIKSILKQIAHIDEKVESIEPELFCEQQAIKFPSEKSYWDYLKNLRPNNKFKVHHRKFVYEAEFIQINQDKPLYPVQAKIKGKVHNFKLRAIILHP